MFVRNDIEFDSRVRKEAASLAGAGHTVTVVATPLAGARTEAAAPFAITRVPERRRLTRPRTWNELRDRPWRLAYRSLRQGHIAEATAIAPWAAVRAVRSAVPVAGRSVGDGRSSGVRWLAEWRDKTAGWGMQAARAAPPSDVFHGHDADGLYAALAAARRQGGARVVYDCHDLLLDSGTGLGRPEWALAVMGAVQQRWLARVDATITVSPGLATELTRLGAPSPLVLRNCPPLADGIDDDGRLRRTVGARDDEQIVLYHGALIARRGIELLLRLADEPGLDGARFVFMGFGRLEDEIGRVAARNARVHLLPAVPPEELRAWLVGADVGVAVYEETPNYRAGLPNKLFECLMAGVPVVASDFPAWRQLLYEDPDAPLGRVVDQDSRTEVAGAIADLLAERRAGTSIRERCRRAAIERHNWETEAERLVDLYRELDRD
jgi:glycosyltransferase involved in cell wall biosynthesis